MQTWKCAHCGDVIGVYEPLIVIEESGERQTSRAAEPELEQASGRHYHRNCRVAVRDNARAS